MADNDDDDDSFGEFTFAPVNSSSQAPVTTGGNDFSLFQNNAPRNQNLKSPPPPPPPQPQRQTQPQAQIQIQPKWEKIKGALPLSIFGDDDDMDDQKTVMPVVGDDFKSDSNKNAHLGINDLIANLYGEGQQQKQAIKEADELDFSAMNSTVSRDSISGVNTVSEVAAGNQGSDDEGGWEFIHAFADIKLAPSEKELSEKTSSVPGGSHADVDLFAAAPNNGFLVESHVIDGSKSIANFQNGFSADLKPDSKGTTIEVSSDPLGGSDDFDDTFGEFETAFTQHSSVKKEVSEERFDTLGSHDTSHRSVDLFSFSNGIPGGSHTESNGFDFSQIPVVENGIASHPFSQTEWKKAKDDSDSQHPNVGADDGSFGEFEKTVRESGSKPQEFEASTKNYKEPVPLSFFGIEEDPEADNPMNLEHELFKSSTHGTHTRTLSSNLSINDILSDLYSQAQPVGSDRQEDLPHSTGKEYDSHAVDDNIDDDDDDDDFNDGSWEFKDASSQSRVENHNSLKKKLNNCMDFYSKLKDDLCVVARQHLHSLKKAQSTTTVAGEEMKVAALNKEIQDTLEKLHQKDIISTEMHLDDHSDRVVSLMKYIETFQEPDFQVLDSEYHISRRLLLAGSDLPTAVDLINHCTTVLKILTLASKCKAADYVSLWFKVISVCSQELNHGTWIWKQSLEKNVHSEILSEKQGRQFIIALGEIYRAVMILEAAVKFYKPWILLSGADLEGVYGLLEECHSLWSTSGLEESIPADYLLESIRHIQNLDEVAIADEILSQDESQCGLSLLSPGVVPEMKMVIWNEDKYFVTLANLWANLISPEPPKLSIHVV